MSPQVFNRALSTDELGFLYNSATKANLGPFTGESGRAATASLFPTFGVGSLVAALLTRGVSRLVEDPRSTFCGRALLPVPFGWACAAFLVPPCNVLELN